jgi:hypothetical protein
MSFVGGIALLVMLPSLQVNDIWSFLRVSFPLLMIIVTGFIWGIMMTLKYGKANPFSMSLGHDIRQAPATEQEFELWREAIIKDLSAHATRIEEQSHQLTQRLIAFHEFEEFPNPIDLNRTSTRAEQAEEQKMRAKDQQVLKLVDQESQIFFDKLKQNAYSVNGQFNWQLMRDDGYNLARNVALIYRPNVNQPLLETSLDLLLRASGRMSFHFLVVLEQLPLDAKSYQIGQVYDSVRKAVAAYGYYRKASPYLGYLSRSFTLGRMVTSTNPVTAGIWWGASELGKLGAETAIKHLVNQQIVAIIQDLVRVVGYEVAAIYGGDFRYRDANWICAVELAEMLASFPLSRESLSFGLNEIGRFPLRNEYDRIFLYRCLANHKSSGWKRVSTNLLSYEERQQVAEILEHCWRTVLHGKTDDRIQKWRTDAEQRLGVKLKLEYTSSHIDQPQQLLQACLVSIAKWILYTKPMDISELSDLLKQTQIGSMLPADQFDQIVNEFEHDEFLTPAWPDIDPADPMLNTYLLDLFKLLMQLPPYHVGLEQEMLAMGQYYRKSAADIQKLLQGAAKSLLSPYEVPVALGKLPYPEQRALIMTGSYQEDVRFVFSSVTLQTREPALQKPLMLVGVADKVYLMNLEGQPAIWWTNSLKTEYKKVGGYLADSCEVQGGKWTPWVQENHPALAVQTPHFIVNGVMTAKYETYFAPLIQVVVKS